jgi:hypothetical protein
MKRFLVASSILALAIYAAAGSKAEAKPSTTSRQNICPTAKSPEAKRRPCEKNSGPASKVQGRAIPPAALPPSVNSYKTAWNNKPMTAYKYEPQGAQITYLMVIDGSTTVSGEHCKFNGGNYVGVNVKYAIKRSAPHNAVADSSSYPSFTFPNAWELAGCGKIGATAAPITNQPQSSSVPSPSNPVSGIQAVDLDALPKAKRQLSADVTVSTSTENGKRLNNYRYSGLPSEEKYGKDLSIFENTTYMYPDRGGKSEFCHFTILHNGRERSVYTSSRHPNWVLDGVQNTERLDLSLSSFPNVWALAGCYRSSEIPESVSEFKTRWNEKSATGYRNEHLSGDKSYLIVLDGTANIAENRNTCTFNGGNNLGANQKLEISPHSPDEVYDNKSFTLAFLFPNAWKLAGCGRR